MSRHGQKQVKGLPPKTSYVSVRLRKEMVSWEAAILDGVNDDGTVSVKLRPAEPDVYILPAQNVRPLPGCNRKVCRVCRHSRLPWVVGNGCHCHVALIVSMK